MDMALLSQGRDDLQAKAGRGSGPGLHGESKLHETA
jgi:hypothetical protein